MQVTSFFLRDDSTRVKAGQKATITRNKEKKAETSPEREPENTAYKIQHGKENLIQSILQIKAILCHQANIRRRGNLRLQIHENLRFKPNIAKRENIISTSAINSLIKTIICSEDSVMYTHL